MSFKQGIFIGLGANLGNPEKQFEEAFKRMAPDIWVREISSYYRSAALGPSQPDFLNAVARVETNLDPETLLWRLKGIEQEVGRRESYRWGPRLLDLDLLLYHDEKRPGPHLTLPHPLMLERRFVLEPLYELAGNGPLGVKKSLMYYLNQCWEQVCEKTVKN